MQAQQSAVSAGGDGSSSTGSVAVSIGQVAYSSHSVGVGTKTQGVQQRYELVQVKSTTEPSLVQTNWSKDPILPTKVTIVLTEGQSFQVGVTWDKSTLNIFARGTYTLFGTISLPNYIGNSNQVRAKILVQVLPKPAPRDVTIDNSTFVGSTSVFFIGVGAFVVNDPVDNIHVVGLLGDGYDNKFFSIKDNILYWNSAERAPGKVTFSIVVRVTDRDGNTLDKFFTITRTRKDFDSLTITNAFSPNEDRFNDAWGVPELRFYEGVRIQIFNSGGSRLFYTENPDIRWDGTYNGKEMPVGSYYWVIEVIETGEMRRGVLNLIRK
uniref:T9SS type B sorting domain-containing protein n=1 Tax=Algoriphagus sp. TaxID=1872435 RepID=UPI004047DA9B